MVALLAGKPALQSVVDVAVRTQQNNDAAAAAGLAGALLLEKVVLVSAGMWDWCGAGTCVAGACVVLLVLVPLVKVRCW